MKANYTVLSTFLVLMMTVQLFGQSIDEKVTVGDFTDNPLFRQGTSIVDLLPNVSFENTKTDADNAVKTSTANINLRGNYYPWDLSDKLGGGNLGLVGGLHYRNVATETEGFNNKSASGFFMFEAGVQYGIYLGGWPVRAELTGGFGSFHLGANESNATSLALNFNVATYIPLGASDAYVMPYLGYGTVSNQFGEEDFDTKICVNGLFVGASLVRPIGCGDVYCPFSERASGGLYRQGTHQSQFLQNGLIGWGNELTTADFGFPFEYEANRNGYNVQLSHYYYFLDNVAGGLGFDVLGTSQEPKQNSNGKTRNTNWTVMPMVRLNVPSESPALNNLFVDGGVGFGANTTKAPDSQGGETKTKNNIFSWDVGVGYNLPFNDHFSAITTFHYISSKSTNSEDADISTKTAGTRFMAGLAYRWNNK